MFEPGRSLPRTVIVAGGGPAALEAVLALREAGGTVEIHLLASDTAYAFRPLSVVEAFAAGTAPAYPYSRLERLGVRVHHDSLAAVDPHRRVVVTGGGAELPYDDLVVAVGAIQRRGIANALTFSGTAAVDALHDLIEDVEAGYSEKLAFVAPAGVSWTVPLYELVLQMAHRARNLCLDRVEITVATHEGRPLEVFGEPGADLGERLLRDAGVRLFTGVSASSSAAGRLELGPAHEPLTVDRIVALPVPGGRYVTGLPSDEDGFLPVDPHGRVLGVDHVYAAGDGTDAAIKQGGLAAQEADVAVAALLTDAGLEFGMPAPPPQLRAALIAGDRAWYLRRELRPQAPSEVSSRALWWPPSKIAARLLAPYLDELDAETSVVRMERRLEARAGVRRLGVLGRVT